MEKNLRRSKILWSPVRGNPKYVSSIKISRGREDVELQVHQRRPSTSVAPPNRRLSSPVSEITSGVRISYGSAQAIITDDLGYRKVSSKRVPWLLTEEQHQQRLVVCQWLQKNQFSNTRYYCFTRQYQAPYCLSNKQKTLEFSLDSNGIPPLRSGLDIMWLSNVRSPEREGGYSCTLPF